MNFSFIAGASVAGRLRFGRGNTHKGSAQAGQEAGVAGARAARGSRAWSRRVSACAGRIHVRKARADQTSQRVNYRAERDRS